MQGWVSPGEKAELGQAPSQARTPTENLPTPSSAHGGLSPGRRPAS